VRLDLDQVDVDLATLYDAIAAGDDQRAVDSCPGELLPDDVYEEWTAAPRMRLRESMTGARRLATTAAAHDPASSINHLTHLLDLDPYDEWAHEQLATTLTTCGRHGEARQAELRYRNAMNELGIRPRSLTGAPNIPWTTATQPAPPDQNAKNRVRKRHPHPSPEDADKGGTRDSVGGSGYSSAHSTTVGRDNVSANCSTQAFAVSTAITTDPGTNTSLCENSTSAGASVSVDTAWSPAIPSVDQ
jgi:hypothetical protein